MTAHTAPVETHLNAPKSHAGQLEGLARELARRGLRTRLAAPPGRRPSLHVVNPRAAQLAENIYAGPAHDDTWWYWWSWADRITRCDDLSAAADTIARVLAERS